MGPEPSPEAHLDTLSGDAHGSQGLVLRNLEPHPHSTSPLCFQGPPSPCHPQPWKTGLERLVLGENVTSSSHTPERP